MVPAFGREGASAASSPRRVVGISNALGFRAPFLFPEKAGREYQTMRYLKPIEDLRDHFTIV